MYFIEVLLGLSVFTFLFGLIQLILINNESKLNDLIVSIEVISIILIVICLILYICNALMTCVTIWFGNW